MKTLVISIYDGGYGGFDAAILNDDNMESLKTKTVDYLLDIYRKSEDDEYKSLIKEAIKQDYDRLLICEDGNIYTAKLAGVK